MIVLGVDPSLTGTGWARIDTEDRLTIECGTIATKPSGPAVYARYLRGRFISRFISRFILGLDSQQNLAADLVVIEAPAFASKTGSVHERSGLWWQIVAECWYNGVDVLEVPPTSRAKYGSGKGNASKDAVLAAAVRQYSQAPIANNNEADAVILAAIGARVLGEPIEDHLTKPQLEALVKLRPVEQFIVEPVAA